MNPRTKERLPSALANNIIAAGRGADPQGTFSALFGGGTVRAAVQELAPPPAPPQPVRAPVKPEDAGGNGHAPGTTAAGNVPAARQDNAATVWSRKTYRLRPDQYTALAVLEALMTSQRGERINVSELAREAFDLLIEKYRPLIDRAQLRPGS